MRINRKGCLRITILVTNRGSDLGNGTILDNGDILVCANSCDSARTSTR